MSTTGEVPILGHLGNEKGSKETKDREDHYLRNEVKRVTLAGENPGGKKKFRVSGYARTEAWPHGDISRWAIRSSKSWVRLKVRSCIGNNTEDILPTNLLRLK